MPTPRKPIRISSATLAVAAALTGPVAQGPKNDARANAPAQWALQISDDAALPATGSPDGTGNNAALD